MYNIVTKRQRIRNIYIYSYKILHNCKLGKIPEFPKILTSSLTKDIVKTFKAYLRTLMIQFKDLKLNANFEVVHFLFYSAILTTVMRIFKVIISKGLF